MLVGASGCGNSAIINERMHSVCFGEVAEVLSLAIQANRSAGLHAIIDTQETTYRSIVFLGQWYSHEYVNEKIFMLCPHLQNSEYI